MLFVKIPLSLSLFKGKGYRLHFSMRKCQLSDVFKTCINQVLMWALEELLLMNLMWVLKELSFLWLWFIYCDYQPWMQIIIIGEHD